jgi:hypothetical protein
LVEPVTVALTFVMASFAVGRAVFFLVAPFAQSVESVFRFGGVGQDTVTFGASTSSNAFVMAGFAVVNPLLVVGMRESDRPHHRSRNLDDGGADGQSAQRRTGDKSGGKQGDGKTFHVRVPPYGLSSLAGPLADQTRSNERNFNRAVVSVQQTSGFVQPDVWLCLIYSSRLHWQTSGF